MGNHNLQYAKKWYGKIAQGEVPPHQVEQKIKDIHHKLKLAGITDLSQLDPSGKSTIEDIEAVFTDARADADLRLTVELLRLQVLDMQAHDKLTYNPIEEELIVPTRRLPALFEKAGLDTALFQGEKPPTVGEIDLAVTELEQKLASSNRGRKAEGRKM